MQSLTQFMKKELVFYIKQEYEKGKSIKTISEALHKGGHHKDLVRQAMESLRKHNFNVVKALDEPIEKHLDKELYFDIINSLVKYVEFQLEAGHGPEYIKKVLKDYGHSDDVIDKALNAATNNFKSKKTPEFTYATEAIFVAIILALVVFVSGSTQDDFSLIILGFAPIIFTIISTYVALKNGIKIMYMYLIPIAFTTIFILGTKLQGFEASGMEVMKLAGLNFLVGLLFVYIKITTNFNQDQAIDTLAKEVETKHDKKAKD